MVKDEQLWFREAKYGLFIHFGLYSLLEGSYQGKITTRIAEWIMNDLNIPVSEYEKLKDEFNPIHFDAYAIASKAKAWGMKYIVITTKHHEGFALWNSKCSDYNAYNSPLHKDLIKELADACKKEGLKLGFYYSQAQDWHDEDGYLAHKEKEICYERYLERKCYPQLIELMEDYGEVALLWFDTPMETTYEQSLKMIDIVKSRQPNCIISGRIGHGLGEYMTTGDNFIPALPFPDDFEVPATLNDTWGFSKYDTNWKTPQHIILSLIKIVSRGGNYLLNVGPDHLGDIPQKSIEILDEVAKYVNVNGEAIYGTSPVPIYPYDLPWGMMTCKKNYIYIHVFMGKTRYELLNICNHILDIHILGSDEEVVYTNRFNCEGYHQLEIEGDLNRSNFVYCMHIQEDEPIFEPIIL